MQQMSELSIKEIDEVSGGISATVLSISVAAANGAAWGAVGGAAFGGIGALPGAIAGAAWGGAWAAGTLAISGRWGD